MKERPILFSAPMVRAVLEGRKTQTRRVIKPQPSAGVRDSVFVHSGLEDGHGRELRCPYGAHGDRLWVRETWSDANSEDGPCVLYRANHDRRYLIDEGYPVDYAKYPDVDFAQWAADIESGAEGRWRPSIHMPRWASRITLEITDVRVQRVQSISDEDALAEGIHCVEIGSGYPNRYCALSASWQEIVESQARAHDNPRGAFRDIWEALNGLRGFGWNVNPWVWTLTFKRVEQPA